ncbi:flagellar biosynthesis protein FliS [Exiguobacterium sp. KRL4]|uniref:flagellar protein FliS n=1 Tax=Exiguobacterium sp. KRL4 TaxID=1914536 RepID=UPI0008F80E52|nr:flagellar protein FliS [Exiguobacterium sp. KRL4]OIN68107.1 flagellar biosynthesis protein FliS [Exiguobacterium sp. KRL4]
MTEQELYQMTPQQLTETMLKGLVFQYEQTIFARDERQFDTVNARLQKAYQLLEKLQAGLHDDGGIITAQLDQLYYYLAEQTLQAYIEPTCLEELLQLTEELLITWQAASVKKERPLVRAAHHERYEGMDY